MAKEMLTNKVTLDNFGKPKRNYIRRVISYIAELASLLIVMFGFIVCMCDTADAGKQLTMMFMGLSIMAVGAVFGFISKEVGNVTR